MGKFERALNNDKLLKLFDIDDEEKEELLQMHRERKEFNINKQKDILKIKYDFPIIYLDRKMVTSIVKKFNKNKESITTTIPKIAGYLKFNSEDFINIKYPDEQEVIQLIQEHDEPDMLKNIMNSKDLIYRDWRDMTVYFEIEDGMFNKVEYYSATTGNRMAEKKSPTSISEVLRYIVPDKIDWEISLDADDEIGYSIGIEEARESASMIIYLCDVLVAMSISEILNNKGKYGVSRENINEMIPKNSNENIHLHREIKQTLKKYDTEIYYINK